MDDSASVGHSLMPAPHHSGSSLSASQPYPVSGGERWRKIKKDYVLCIHNETLLHRADHHLSSYTIHHYINYICSSYLYICSSLHTCTCTLYVHTHVCTCMHTHTHYHTSAMSSFQPGPTVCSWFTVTMSSSTRTAVPGIWNGMSTYNNGILSQ